MSSFWYKGPDCLWDYKYKPVAFDTAGSFSPLPEQCEEIKILLTTSEPLQLPIANIFKKFNSLNSLIKASQTVLGFKDICFDTAVDRRTLNNGHTHKRAHPVSHETLHVCVRSVRRKERGTWRHNKIPQKGTASQFESELSKLPPIIDDEGILCIRGRLGNADINFNPQHPILLSRDHPLSEGIVHYFHIKVKHQGVILHMGKYNRHSITLCKENDSCGDY